MRKYEKTLLAQNILHSGEEQATRHPLEIQCLKLILECMKAYNLNTREVRKKKII